MGEAKIECQYASCVATLPGWRFTIRANPVYDHITGPMHRLDLSMLPLEKEESMAVKPHGVVGQSFDGDGQAVDGKKDVYPHWGEFRTSAMGEGALEGDASQYVVPSRFATAFSYSRFGKTHAPYRSTKNLNIVHRAGNAKRSIGATALSDGES